MKEKKSKNIPVKIEDESPEVFEGYSLDELKYQKALLLLKKEFAKEQFLKDVNKVKSQLPGGDNSRHATVFNSGLFGKLAKSLNYMDYIVIGFSLFSTGRKLLSLFRRPRR